MDRPIAALTGASGFLGGHVARALDAAGFRLRILARASAPPPGLEALGPEVVAGRLSDHEALERLVQGAQAVIHIAGAIKAARPADFLTINRDGAEAMARAAAGGAPDAHFVLVSSLSAREPRLSAYAASKAAGEKAVQSVLKPAGLTIVRPPAVYGPGDRETLALFHAAERLPALPLVGGPDARFALVHAVDAAAHIAVIAGRRGGGRTLALADARPEGYGWREVLEGASLAVGRRPALARIPPALVLGIGAANSLAARLGAAPQVLSLGKAREMLHPDWGVRPGELDPDAPPARFDLRQGFADVVDWYCANGWLKRRRSPGASPER
jgi:nucleoside-diphosphate-sugar epimerase